MDTVEGNNICYFERLPPELNCLILLYFNTPTHFYALIRASPLHFRIYLCGRERYLHSIISQCYNRVNLVLALRILTAGRPSASLTEESLVEFKIPDGADRADWISNHLKYHNNETRSFAYDTLSVIDIGKEKSVLEQGKPSHVAESTKLILLRQLCRL